MPRQDDTITIVKAWESIVGRDAKLSEVTYIGWWLDQYNRLPADTIVKELQRIHARELDKGTPDHPIEYYTGPIRDLNDEAKPQRQDQLPPGEGEPPSEPIDGMASPEQALRMQRLVAAVAARKDLNGRRQPSSGLPSSMQPNGR